MTEPNKFEFLMIVDDPGIAAFAVENGLDFLFVDLESHGKEDRQGHLQSWRSQQTLADVSKIRKASPEGKLLVRINPIHDGTQAEIDDAIARGADHLMLPMFRAYDEVARFFDLVGGRAVPHPLFETHGSLEAIEQIVAQLPLERAHIGLNDLHLDMGYRFMFEPLIEGILDEPCALLAQAGTKFGIGGLARTGEGGVPPDLLMGEHVRLGSTGSILSRTFHRNATSLEELTESTDFGAEVAKLRVLHRHFLQASAEEIHSNHEATSAAVRDVIATSVGGVE